MASIVSGLRRIVNTPSLTLTAAMGLSYAGHALSPSSLVSRIAVREGMIAGITEAVSSIFVKPMLSRNLQKLETHLQKPNSTLSSIYTNNVRIAGVLMTVAGCLFLLSSTIPTAQSASYEFRESISHIDLTSLDQIGRLLSVGSLFSTAFATANISADFIAGGLHAIYQTIPKRQESYPMYSLV